MSENKQVKSNRELYNERLKAKYPDKEFADDEAVFGQINDDYDNYDQELADYRDREKSLSELFSSDPRSAAFLMDWKNGENPLVGMIRKYGDMFKEALDDPQKQEELAAASKEYAERIAKERDYEEQYQKNISESLITIESVQKEEGIEDDEIDNIIELLIGIMKDAVLGKFSKESILMAHKAINHDADVAIADREGEVRGKNTKIKESLRKSQKSDGMPTLNGQNGGVNERRRHKTMFDLANEAM